MRGPASFNHVTGYCTPLVAHPGGTMTLHASAQPGGPLRIRAVRLSCLNAETVGPAQRIEATDFGDELIVNVTAQTLDPGSRIEARLPDPITLERFSLGLALMPTRGGRVRLPLSFQHAGMNGFALGIDADDMLFMCAGTLVIPLDLPVPLKRWSVISLAIDLPAGRVAGTIMPYQPGMPTPRGEWVRATASFAATAPIIVDGLTVGAGAADDRIAFDGRIDRPTLALDLTDLTDVILGSVSPSDTPHIVMHWAFAATASAVQVLEGPLRLTGRMIHHPLTGVKGVRWTGESHDRRLVPDHYSAIHLNADAMTDAGWDVTTSLAIPLDTRQGIYAFELTASDGTIGYASFVVSGAGATATSKKPIAVLLPTYSYVAYANAPTGMRGADAFAGQHLAEDLIDRANGAFGRSLYERFADRSGVVIASERRPLISLGPGHQPWGYIIDSWLLDWLDTQGQTYDLITDHDLHSMGRSALDGYVCVITGHHPEYFTTAMWDGLSGWLGSGGRLIYLGGNGFYWRTAVDGQGAIEVRRAEDGTRPFIGEPGEYVHAFTDEVGGLWRRLGRPPQTLVGVGMAAQGFSRSAPYLKGPDATDPLVSFVFADVEAEVFGQVGTLGNGASGYEIDRYDPDLGSSIATFLLASSQGHAGDMMRTKEEMLSFVPPFTDRKARSDMVLSPHGQGAVFAVGSMTWIGSLHDDVSVSKITSNVIKRFVDPQPLIFKASAKP
ncbi:MAG: N,N-dimethylformamidase beta subunit family domain-containing protein [Bosea sp. (in: a-proteobacteria)]|jgi:N,N-dimethylformamidase